MADVFVSYSRKDGEFVHELYDVLTAAGRDVWVDWEDIPPASEWEQDDLRLDRRGRERRLRRQPELARVEVLRRRAAARRRRRQARRADRDRRRRSRPRRRRRSGSSTGSGRATTDDRAAAFAALERALDTDLEWSRAHTRLLVRAVEWDERKDGEPAAARPRPRGGRARARRERGQGPAPDRAPAAVPAREPPRRLAPPARCCSAASRAALAVSIGLGVVALLQRNTANDRARVAESQTLALQSADALETSPRVALGHAVEAYETSPTPEARVALRRALVANPVVWTVAGRHVRPAEPGRAQSLAFSPDGSAAARA